MLDPAPGLLLECSSESLTHPQTFKIKKLQDDLARLKLLLRNGAGPVIFPIYCNCLSFGLLLDNQCDFFP